jgi:hypothetical protein
MKALSKAALLASLSLYLSACSGGSALPTLPQAARPADSGGGMTGDDSGGGMTGDSGIVHHTGAVRNLAGWGYR